MKRFFAIAIVLTAVPVCFAQPGGPGFTDDPAVRAMGDGYEITFALSEGTDVEVAIVNAGGDVVRHLAAGVLGGDNPPPAPLVKGLVQKLTWDGRGDWNQAAGDGPFTVRVRAGMSVGFGRTVGQGPYNFAETYCRGLAVDPASGDLYVLAAKTRDSVLYFLRVFDRTGKYLREIMPYPGGTDAASRDAFGQVPMPDSPVAAPMNYLSTWPVFYPIDPGGQGRAELSYKLIAVNPAEGSAVMLNENFARMYRVRMRDGGVVGDGFATPVWASGTKLAGSAGVGPVAGAVSPDGKRYYFAGYAGGAPKGEKRHPNWPDNRVYRMDAGGTARTFAEIELPADAKGPQTSWSYPGNIQALHGVAVDKAGRVYVCDAAGGKVWVLDSAGKTLGSVAVPHAYCVAVNDRSGALYVLTRCNTAYGVWPRSLVKLDGWQAGAKAVDTLELPDRGGSSDPFLAGDFSGDTPQLWIGGAPRGESILRVQDVDGKLKAVEDLADRGRLAPGFACRLDVDPEKDLVYTHNGWARILRYDGLTGQYAGELDKAGHPQPIIGSEFCIRRDGMIYLSGSENAGGGYSGAWRRLTRDLKPAPLADGRKEFSDRYGKMGGGYFGNQGSCVTPDGHLYFNGMFTFRINAIFEVNPDGSPGRCPRLREPFADAQISPACTKAGFTGALVGWLQDQSGGVQVDQQGNVYAGIRILPRGYKLPEGMADAAKKLRSYGESIGCVVKFNAAGGGMVADRGKPGEPYTIDKAWKYKFTEPAKFEGGLPMGFGQRLDWYEAARNIYMEGGVRAYPILATFSNQCACQTPRFAVDDYGRLYIPNALGCRVQVLDNEGNPIVTFGQYGNSDDQAAARAGQAAIPLAYPISARASFRHIYVADSANRQIVRVDPAWALEMSCPVK
ncbi:MAG: hypothetical protein BIFFINMI_00707 [Phycisphaerae bacterium]|nr:hypothetical protein [Phycisphaerae bacterium]